MVCFANLDFEYRVVLFKGFEQMNLCLVWKFGIDLFISLFSPVCFEFVLFWGFEQMGLC